MQFFAYPNGDYGSREIDVLKKLDYGLAFASQPGYITEEIAQNKFALPRFGFLEGASKAENICRIIGLWKLNSLRVNRPAPVIDSNQTKYKKEGEVLADSQLSN